MYWTRLVLVWPAASLYSACPLKHHARDKQWCPNRDHYPDSEPASRSLTLMCWALKQSSRTFCLIRPWIEPPTSCMPGKRSTTTLPNHIVTYKALASHEVPFLCLAYSCTCMGLLMGCPPPSPGRWTSSLLKQQSSMLHSSTMYHENSVWSCTIIG